MDSVGAYDSARRGRSITSYSGWILANVRTPVEREGDLMAQLMSIRRGEARLRELVSKYGEAVVERNMRGLQNYSERMMRATLRGLPAGTYRFEDVLEGERSGEFFFRYASAVTLAGDTAVVDFTGSSGRRWMVPSMRTSR